MQRPKKKPAALAAGEVMEGPYTQAGNGARKVVNSTEAAELRALDRKLTDGLNLVHGQLAVLREERREDRREFRAEFAKVDERLARMEAAMQAGFAKVDERSARMETTMRAEIAKVDSKADERSARLEAAMQAGFAKADERFARMEAAIQGLTAKVSTSLERASGTRRLIWGVLGALGLLLAGAAIRPLLERAVSALLAG